CARDDYGTLCDFW
nr:immunoglobulin heavy chain junction region [Macaca mulatta]MOV53886.1 immunoglobulin heavy chain junction region [Macaca mulatta]MOV54006.1 immunoglobulin heavy chain junction region [Macaca mulatta]MOV54189.1 immunoglobulin heavy chain junction region [Macaca mulatta]MOV54367.1 immunoglobulin heavy chain junction region [Macaca mulatta]